MTIRYVAAGSITSPLRVVTLEVWVDPVADRCGRIVAEREAPRDSEDQRRLGAVLGVDPCLLFQELFNWAPVRSRVTKVLPNGWTAKASP